ncbi:MAG TPA: TrkA family potassium uptake protein [Candidatus Methylomirabilis sp.]|nr:TrkA family potassium uptake protein [Candidatus Methylomirabilis sp.]HSC70988.1 TrkA family potassium uptake protein [Candidatus Methylomirabilis sp.]
MRVVIVGCGRVGSNLANTLSAERHEVVVIDRNPLSFGRLSREFTGRMLTGVGFDREILQKADIEGAEALAATTDSDNVNIVVAVTAKETFKVPRVVARIYNPQAAEIYRREGIPTVTPTLWGANAMRAMLLHPGVGTITTYGSGEVHVLEVEIPSSLVGRSVQDLSSPGESLVGILVRRGQASIPRPDARLEAGDILRIAATATAIPRLQKLMAHS